MTDTQLSRIDLHLLGGFRLRLNGEERHLSEPFVRLLWVLGLTRRPLTRQQISRELLGCAPSTLRSLLTRIPAELGVSQPLHSVVRPRSGAIALAPFVSSDVVQYMAQVEKSIAAGQRGDRDAERQAAIEADRIWRGPPTPPPLLLPRSVLLADLIGELTLMRERQAQLVEPTAASGPSGRGPSRYVVVQASEDPRFLHVVRAAAVLCAIVERPSGQSHVTVDAEIVRDALKMDRSRWTEAVAHWTARQVLTSDGDGVHFASAETPVTIVESLDPHEFRSICGRLCDTLLTRTEHNMSAALGRGLVRLARSSDRKVTHQSAIVRALLRHAEEEFVRRNYDESIATLTTALSFAEETLSIEIRLRRAEAFHLAARWDEAEEDLTRAQSIAQVLKDHRSEASAFLAMAHVTWDPQRFGDLETRLRSLRDMLSIESDRLLRIRVEACLAGGTYQDGTSGAGLDGTELARTSLAAIDEFSDPWTRAELAIWCRKGLLDVVPTGDSLRLAQRIEDEAAGSDSHLANGILAQIVDHLRRGEVDDALHQTSRYHLLAERTGSPLHRFIRLTNEAMWNIAQGQFALAESLVEEAAPIGARFGGVTAKQIAGAQRIWIWRMSGELSRNAELSKLVQLALPPDGRLPIWSVTKALILTDAREYDAAVAALHKALPDAEQSISQLKRGPLRISVLALAAEVLYAVRSLTPDSSRDRMAAALQRELTAHGDRGVLVGWPTLFLGPTDRYTALAAAAQGHDDEALELLNKALASAVSVDSVRRVIEQDIGSLQQSKLRAAGQPRGSKW